MNILANNIKHMTINTLKNPPKKSHVQFQASGSVDKLNKNIGSDYFAEHSDIQEKNVTKSTFSFLLNLISAVVCRRRF